MNRDRIAITGLGVVSPVGVGHEAFWQALVAGKSGISHIAQFDCRGYATRIAGEARDFDPREWMEPKAAKRMDRFAQFAVAAALTACQDAGLSIDDSNADRVGVIVGSGIGGIWTWEHQFDALRNRGPDRVSPFFVPMMIANMAAGQVSIVLGAKGPGSCVTTACASGAHAIGDAFQILRRGEADVMLAGGSEAAITPMGIAGFGALRALSTRNDEPERASRPFDALRDGFVMGEGAGVLVLETEGHAVARGAHIYGELVGYGMSADAFHITEPAPEGDGPARAMQAALRSAGMRPEEVDYINAHGTGTPLNDRVETKAIHTVFGGHAGRLAVSSTKSMTGHLLGAAAAVEMVATVLACYHSIIPPTINYENPDPECDLDYVANRAREAPVRAALCNAYGFGGQNAVLAVKAWE
jgi:3-oxoacyl-[acyl-carrier-protein] synthase II